MVLNVHSLGELHLLIAIPLRYSSILVRAITLLGFRSFDDREQILFVLRVHGLRIDRKQTFNQSGFLSVLKISKT